MINKNNVRLQFIKYINSRLTQIWYCTSKTLLNLIIDTKEKAELLNTHLSINTGTVDDDMLYK